MPETQFPIETEEPALPTRQQQIAELLRRSEHRLWQVPDEPWVMTQTWEHVLFAHWPVAAAELQRHLPPGLTPDTFQGQAWLGIVPFQLSELALRGWLKLPLASSFAEINVRTYVTLDGKPGVYFLSLDAHSIVAVTGARLLYLLPYHYARAGLDAEGERLRFHSRRLQRLSRPAEFAATYAPASDIFLAQPRSLESWLTERYCLYTVDGAGRLHRGDIQHRQWPLQAAEADISLNTMAPPDIHLPAAPPLLLYAGSLQVVFWPLAAVDEPAP